MKILYYLDGLNHGGIERITVQLSQYFNRRGNEIHIVCLYQEMMDLKNELPTTVMLHSLPFKKNKKSYFQYFKYFTTLRKLLNKIQPDIIHAHNSSLSYFFLALVVRMSKLRAINIRTIHFMGFFLERKSLVDKIRLYFDKTASKLLHTTIIPVSPETQIIVEKNYHRNRIILITNGVDVKNISNTRTSKTKLGICENSIVGVYTARLSEGKNHKILLYSWNKIVALFPNALLILIGDGPLRKELEDYCKMLGIRCNVLFTGSVSNVAEYLSISDIGIFPSESEGFGLGLCEMMAANLPVVVSNIPTFRLIIQDESSGLFFDTYNPDDLANKLIKILSDKELAIRLGDNARESVIKNYSLDFMLDKYEKLYQREYRKKCD